MTKTIQYRGEKKITQNTERKYASEETRDSDIHPIGTAKPTTAEKEGTDGEEGTDFERTEKGEVNRKITYDYERKTLIKMANGLRTMNISSINTDSTKAEQMRRYIIKNITRNKIHRSATQ